MLLTSFTHSRRPSISPVAGLLLLAVGLALAACEPADPLESIRQRHAAGQYAETVEPLRERIAEHPEDAEAIFLYGRALAANGDVSAATWALREAMEDEEWRLPAARQLVTNALASQDFNEVVELTTELLEDDPDDVIALLYRAQAQAYWKRDQEAALADAKRVLEMEPDRIEAYEPMILSLIGLERYEEAGEKLAEAGRRLEDLDAHEGTLAWHCATTATFVAASEGEGAGREHWRSCLERYPANATVVSGAVAFYDSLQDWPRSLEVLEVAHAEEPGGSYRNALAGRLAHRGRAAEGEAILQEATHSDDPRIAAAAWLDLASFWHRLGDFEAAATAIGRSIEETRKFDEPGPQLLFQWADTQILSGKHDRALEIAEEISVPALQTLIRARVAQERGDAEAALDGFDKALQLWPNNARARYYAALAAEQVGDFERALEEYRYAVRSDVGATDARTRGARLLIADGQLQRAYLLLFLDVAEHPLEREGELLSMYLMARAANPKQLQDALRRLALRDPGMLPEALARGALGASETAGPRSALGLLRNPPDLDYTSPVSAPALRMLVQLAHAAGEPELARERVAAALAAAPQASDFHEIRGLHLELSGADPAEARAAYERAIELDPVNAAALLGLGRLEAQRDLATAAQLFDRAVMADPSEAAAKLAVARALMALGRIGEARERLEVTLAQHPFEAEAAEMLVSIALRREEVTAQTLDWAKRAARFGRSAEAYERLAEVAGELGDSDLGERAALQAAELRQRAASAPGEGGDDPDAGERMEREGG